MIKPILAILALIVTTSLAVADTVGLAWSYNSPVATREILGSDGLTPLSGSGTTASGDGFVLQLGYYSSATAGSPFTGTWVPVFGKGTSNSLFPTAGFGDFGSGPPSGTDARFSFSGTIDTTVPSTTTGIPTAGQIMSIRYYNATTIMGATFYGAASNASWMWISPAALPPIGMSFAISPTDVTMVYQGGVGSPQTNLVIPEPATTLLLALGAMVPILRRRR